MISSSEKHKTALCCLLIVDDTQGDINFCMHRCCHTCIDLDIPLVLLQKGAMEYGSVCNFICGHILSYSIFVLGTGYENKFKDVIGIT